MDNIYYIILYSVGHAINIQSCNEHESMCSERVLTHILALVLLGAACVVFSSHASYIAAVSARFMQLNYGSLDKKVC